MRFLSLFNKSSSLIGLDIQPNSMSLLELSYDKFGYHLLACAKTEIDQKDPAGAVREILSLAKPSGKTIALAFDHCLVVFKTATVDATLNEDEIFCHLHNQASQSLHLSVDELLLDFAITKTATTKKSAVKEIGYVAAKRHHILPWIIHLQAAGFNVGLIDVHSLALQRAAKFLLNQYLTIALMCISEQSLLLIITQGGNTLYIQAEPRSAPIIKQRQEVTNKILHFINRSLQFYYHCENPSPISLILLAGNLGAIDAALIQQQTNLEVEIANPWKNINTSQNPTALCGYKAHEFMPSFGLALRCAEQLC